MILIVIVGGDKDVQETDVAAARGFGGSTGVPTTRRSPPYKRSLGERPDAAETTGDAPGTTAAGANLGLFARDHRDPEYAAELLDDALDDGGDLGTFLAELLAAAPDIGLDCVVRVFAFSGRLRTPLPQRALYSARSTRRVGRSCAWGQWVHASVNTRHDSQNAKKTPGNRGTLVA